MQSLVRITETVLFSITPIYLVHLLISAKGNEFPDNGVTSHLFADGRRPDTAFQRYRNSRLGGEFHSEITGRSLSECLDECLRQASFQCRSAVYSDRFRICRLSRFNQRDGHRIIYDADYDYYENLMSNVIILLIQEKILMLRRGDHILYCAI